MKTIADSSTGETKPVVEQHVALSAINFDPATQVRVEIIHEAVGDYAECMEAGDKFPPLDLFIDGDHYWIGDGWHRALALKENGTVTCCANVHEGGRLGAIKYALGANQQHGLRRTHADMWKAIRIALREFGNLSDRQIAEMCGVDHKTIASQRNWGNSPVEPQARLGADGKVRHLPRSEPEAKEPAPRAIRLRNYQMPAQGMHLARGALGELKKILPTDGERIEALTMVRDWCETELKK
jgi:hypothetical protein